MRNVSHRRYERIIIPLQGKYEKVNFSEKEVAEVTPLPTWRRSMYERRLDFPTNDMSFVFMDINVFWTYFGESDNVFTIL
jgi:hypothetical protein